MDAAQKLLVTARFFALANMSLLVVLFASAGLYLQDSHALGVHAYGSIGIHIVSGLLAAALALRAVLIRTGATPAAAAAVFFGLTFLQGYLGSATSLAAHVVGSLVLTVIAVWLTIWCFIPARPSRSS